MVVVGSGITDFCHNTFVVGLQAVPVPVAWPVHVAQSRAATVPRGKSIYARAKTFPQVSASRFVGAMTAFISLVCAITAEKRKGSMTIVGSTGEFLKRRRRHTMAGGEGVLSANTSIAMAGVANKEGGGDVSMSSLRLFSPAKINLFLRIMRRREDGYHDLASLFHTVALGDTLDLKLLPMSAEADEFSCNMPGVPLDDSNLVIRALNLFRKKSGVKRFFLANLRKVIPAQAGMGGGSSNAATALFGANALCGSPGSAADLLRWTDDPVIGSDATFFLSEGAAYCTGRGEILTPIQSMPFPPDLVVYLVKPRMGLSTPQIFKALDVSTTSSEDPAKLLRIFEEQGTDHPFWINDLEKPAFMVSPELGQLKAFLSGEEWGFKAVLMSGSGSTIFCLGEPHGGKMALEMAAHRRGFNLEGVWRTHLSRRNGADAQWYQPPEEEIPRTVTVTGSQTLQ
eukprot:TRINITY_DN74627_c0_g1_i1.p1 TRINITY_DN74627_c0_g1~~TRINITY_DN74627_c0_g1_i1.p1  ORF type:complete len:530 (-),score=76.10 TRINITY_DN74627_c0_g1_i1:119-1483(-)